MAGTAGTGAEWGLEGREDGSEQDPVEREPNAQASPKPQRNGKVQPPPGRDKRGVVTDGTPSTSSLPGRRGLPRGGLQGRWAGIGFSGCVDV